MAKHADVEIVGITQERDIGALRGRGTGIRDALNQVTDGGGIGPYRLVQYAVHYDFGIYGGDACCADWPGSVVGLGLRVDSCRTDETGQNKQGTYGKRPQTTGKHEP